MRFGAQRIGIPLRDCIAHALDTIRKIVKKQLYELGHNVGIASRFPELTQAK